MARSRRLKDSYLLGERSLVGLPSGFLFFRCRRRRRRQLRGCRRGNSGARLPGAGLPFLWRGFLDDEFVDLAALERGILREAAQITRHRLRQQGGAGHGSRIQRLAPMSQPVQPDAVDVAHAEGAQPRGETRARPLAFVGRASPWRATCCRGGRSSVRDQRVQFLVGQRIELRALRRRHRRLGLLLIAHHLHGAVSAGPPGTRRNPRGRASVAPTMANTVAVERALSTPRTPFETG